MPTLSAAPDPTARREELEQALEAVRARVGRACRQVGRSPEEVTLVVVTKFFPAQDVTHLVDLGVHDIGESRDQEAGEKLADVRAVAASSGGSVPRVHFIGQVQTNKARSIVRYADVVHSVDRPKLVAALDRAVAAAVQEGERGTPLDVLVQVDLEEGERGGRGGVPPVGLPELADQVAACEHLRLRGVMAVAPPDLDVAGVEAAFAGLAELAGRTRSAHPGASWLSAGMSADLEQAVAAGATHLRVGSAILGSRPPAR